MILTMYLNFYLTHRLLKRHSQCQQQQSYSRLHVHPDDQTQPTFEISRCFITLVPSLNRPIVKDF